MGRMLYALATLIVLIVVAGWLTKPAALKAPTTSTIPSGTYSGDIDALLANRESAVGGIIDGAEKRIRWAGAPNARTEYVLIYLHGFSATRQEITPVPEQVAEALGANLFEARLAGHGLEEDPLQDVSAEQWIEDGVEALAIGRTLGDKLILMGTSTGATLAVALSQHPDFAAVDALVFMSPNFGPAASGSGLATGPFGPQLVRILTGEYRSWEPANEQQGRFWATHYPTRSLIEMMRLVDLAVAMAPTAKVPRAMLIYSPGDEVVSVPLLLENFERMPAGEKSVNQILDGGGPSNHVLSGNILAPQNNLTTVAMISSFLGSAQADD